MPSVLIMSAVQNCLNRYLFFPNICGSFLFNFHGQIQLHYIRIFRILFSLGAYLYFVVYLESLPRNGILLVVSITEEILIGLATGILIRASWRIKNFRISLDLMESVSGFVNDSKIKLIFWPSIISNILIFFAVSDRALVFSKSYFYYFAYLHILLLLNAFTDELSTLLLLLKFLSETLNTHLGSVTNREDLVSILKAQNMLCTAVQHINNLYSTQILFLMALSFYCTISFTYILILQLLHANTYALTLIIWIISFLQMSVKIILTASSLTNSIESFDVRLYEILKKRPPAWTKLILVEDLMFDRTVRLTAAGCFDLTIENLGSMLSMATTYLILLVQMD